jgi:3-hydroxyacyl-CoA dehydrogenase
VLADAKARCVALASGYQASAPRTVHVNGAVTKHPLLAQAEAAKGHDKVIFGALAYVLSAGGIDGQFSEAQLLALEHEAFMELIQTTASQERIAYMLENGKPLKN